MLDYELLNELGCESPVSGGLEKTIYVIPAWAVISTPAYSVVPSSEPIRLVAGATSTSYTFPEDVLKFREEGKIGPQGDFTELSLEGYRNRLNPGHMEELRKLSPGHYIVIYVDHERQQRILGTKDKPMIFSWVADTGARDSDKSGIVWTFKGVGDGPTVFQNPLIPPPNQVVDPTAVLNFIEDTAEDCSYNLQGFTSRQKAGDLITSITPALAVDLIYEFRNAGNLLYSGTIDPGDDPTSGGNWSVVAGTRSSLNFTDEIITQITGTNAVDFILDLTEISLVLSTPGQLEVSLIIDEGGDLSPPDSVILDLCYTPPAILSIVSVLPADNSTDVSPTLAEVEVDFSENIVDLGGYITLRDKSDDSLVYTEILAGANVTITNENITWTLPGALDINKEYYVEILAGALEGVSGAGWPGTTPDTFNFSTIFNSPPQSTNLSVDLIGSGFETGQDVQISSLYYDYESDLQDLPGTVTELVRFNNISDATNKVNGTVIHTGKTVYTLTISEGDKYIAAREVPKALTGTLQGAEFWSDVQLVTVPKVLALTYTHTNQTHELRFAGTNNVEFLIEWGDSNTSLVTASGLLSLYSHNYASPGTYTVIVKTVDPTNLFSLTLENEDLTVLDLTETNGIISLKAASNPALASFSPPGAHAANIATLDLFANGCASLDLTNLQFLNAYLWGHSSPSLQSVDLTGSTGTLQELRFDSCDLTGNMVIPSGLNMTTSTGNKWILFDANPSMTGLDLSNMSGKAKLVYFNNCNITGSLDFGSLDFEDVTIRAMVNPLMTGFDISGCSGVLKSLDFTSCALSGTQYISLPFTANSGNTLIMTLNSTNTFDVDFTGSGGKMSTLRFDNSKLNGNFSCSVFEFTSATVTAINADSMTGFDISGCTGSIYLLYLYGSGNLTGDLDLSPFTFPGLYMRVEATQLTSLTWGSSSGTVNFLRADNCSFSGTIVFSSLTFLSNSWFEMRANTSITEFDFSNCSGTIKTFKVDLCNITGVLDLSMFHFQSSDALIYAHTNANLTGVKHGASTTGSIKLYFTYGTQAVLQTNNLGLMTIQSDGNFEFYNCGLAAGDVDNWFIEIESKSVSSGASGSMEGGGTNAAPTAGSLTERNNLISAGYTVITS